MKEKIYILLPVHNRREITRLFVNCLKVQTFGNYNLLLVDDGSTDGTEEMVRANINNLTVIRGQGSWWWAGSLQQGYLWLKSQHIPLTDLLLIMNDDTLFEPDFLERAVSIMKMHENALLMAECYSHQTGQLIDAGVHMDLKRLIFSHASSPEEINCLSTRGLVLRLSDFIRIGGFRPRLLPHYLSDYEFTIRAHKKGMKLMTDPSFRLSLDERATGHHQIEREHFVTFMRKLFSRKYGANPLTMSVFALLVSPWPWKLVNVLRVWKGAAVIMWRFLRGADQK